MEFMIRQAEHPKLPFLTFSTPYVPQLPLWLLIHREETYFRTNFSLCSESVHGGVIWTTYCQAILEPYHSKRGQW